MRGFRKKRVTAWFLLILLILSTFGGLSSPVAAQEQVGKGTIDLKTLSSKVLQNFDSGVSTGSEPQQVTQQTAAVSFPQNLTDWILDQETGTIYAISDTTNKLYFLNKQTLTVKKEIQLSGAPNDLYKFENKLYISQANNLIQSVDTATQSLDEQYTTNSKPNDVAVSTTHIFFASDYYVFSIDRATKAVKKYNIFESNLDLQVGSDSRILYVAEKRGYNSDFFSYDIVDDKVISTANVSLRSPWSELILDGQSAYFAGYRMKTNDLTDISGEYPREGFNQYGESANILSVNGNVVLTTQGIFEKDTYLKVATLPFEAKAGLLDDDGSVYLFKSESSASDNKLYHYSITANEAPTVQFSKAANTLVSNFTITDWATTEDTPYIYAISENANALTVIRKSDFSAIKSVWTGSRPVDVEVNNGKVYVALKGATYIAQFNVADTEKPNIGIEWRFVKGLPAKIQPFNGKIFYYNTEDRSSLKVLTENNGHDVLPVSNYYFALDAKEAAVYTVGMGGHAKVDANTHKVILSRDFHDVGFYAGSNLHKDGNSLYYDNKRVSASDLTTLYGLYPENILYAKDELVFGKSAIYDRDSFSKIIELPSFISKAYVADDQSIILSSQNKLSRYADLDDLNNTNVTPKGALLIDTDNREGWIGGYLAIVPAENAAAVQSYNVYLTNYPGNKLKKLDMVLDSQENGVLYYKLSASYDAAYLQKLEIYPVLSGGVEHDKYILAEIWDSPTYFARKIRLTNTQFTAAGFSGTITWDRANRYPEGSSYQIYFMDEDGLIGDPIKTVVTNYYQQSYSVDLTNVPIPYGAIGIGITLRAVSGEMPPYIAGAVFDELKSPAPLAENITIKKYIPVSDSVTVTGLTAGDIIRVYNEAETILLGQGTVAAGQTSVTISIPNIGSPGQKVRVTRETLELYESTGTLVFIPDPSDPPVIILPPVETPPPVVTPPVITPPPGPALPTTFHTITATAGEHGTISPSGSVSVGEGTNQTFTIVAEKGYEIDKLLVDGIETSDTNNRYTFSNVKVDHTISVTFKVAKDTTAPWAPDVNEVTDTAVSITGTAEAGAKVTARVGSKVIGSVLASGTGEFQMKIAKQVAGTKILVTATDEANNVSEPTEVIVKDVTAPAAPKMNVVGDNVGKVTGKAEIGSTVTVLVGSKVIGKGTADKNGNFTVSIPKQKAGTVLKVVAVDRAKNISKITTITVVDKTPPAKPVVNTISSTSTFVTGKAEVGSTVMVKVGSKLIGTGTTGKDGKFSVKIPKQKVKMVLSVIAKDKSGNESTAVKVTVKK